MLLTFKLHALFFINGLNHLIPIASAADMDSLYYKIITNAF